MTNMTLAIPKDLMQKMRKFKEIKWSEIARRAIEQRTNELELIEKIASKSKLTQKDAKEISKNIKARANKRFLNESYS